MNDHNDEDKFEFDIHRRQVARYSLVKILAAIFTYLVFAFVLAILIFADEINSLTFIISIGIICLLISGLLIVGVGYRLLWNWSQSLRYELKRNKIRIYQEYKLFGLMFYRSDNGIPLQQITDLKLVQGPVLYVFNIFNIQIQTAGQGGDNRYEAVMYGPKQPKQLQENLLDHIQELPGNTSQND